MKLSDSKYCKWCDTTPETILHLYWQCPKSVELWEAIDKLFYTLYGIWTKGNTLLHLFGYKPEGEVKIPEIFYTVSSLTRHYIHMDKCKGGNRSKIGLENYIKSVRNIEWQIATNINTLCNFYRRWDRLSEIPETE